ncbi:MAG TPA: hypothetical protein VK484_06355, partial [Ferruginibacter sp.]|nr:hypothetical protein [Ferruginibacter sp.]
NGIATNLTDGTKSGHAHCVVVYGNDVYIVGNESTGSNNYDYISKYWKNGVPVNLGSTNPKFFAHSIFLTQ